MSVGIPMYSANVYRTPLTNQSPDVVLKNQRGMTGGASPDHKLSANLVVPFSGFKSNLMAAQ